MEYGTGTVLCLQVLLESQYGSISVQDVCTRLHCTVRPTLYSKIHPTLPNQACLIKLKGDCMLVWEEWGGCLALDWGRMRSA